MTDYIESGMEKLLRDQGERWTDARRRVQLAMEFVERFLPEYSEPVRAMIAAEILGVIDLRACEHDWNCPGEECRYHRACLKDNARRAGFGG